MPFQIEVRPYGDDDVVRMVGEVQDEYVLLYGTPDNAALERGEFEPPGGLFLVGLLDGEPVATGGWRRRADVGRPPAAEIKRMYVSARARRRGLAKLVLAEIERTATAAGIERLVLNTGTEQPEAIDMYRSCGYEPIPAFGYYADYCGAVFLGKRLSMRGSVSRG